MTSKRIPIHLTVAEKHEVLMMRERNETPQTIMEKYGISRSALYRIFTNSERIKKQFQTCEGVGRFPKRLTQHTVDVDRVVLHWYLRCKERNVQLTEADVRTKAIEINKKLKGYSFFKASSFWLNGFRKRYNISYADIRENVSTAGEIYIGDIYTASVNDMLLRNKYTLKNVYNVVYTTLMWKAVPEKTCILDHAKSTGNLKICEDYITALFCANATGNHKLPVLLIGREPDIHRLYNYDTKGFSTIYKSSTNACMNSTIFKQWYKELFLESIKGRQRENESEDKYLLLLGNAMSPHDLNELSDIDQFVTIKTSPVNASPLTQPMNCGIITCFKRKYRIELVETIRPIYSKRIRKQGVIDYHKQLTMWDCCRIVHAAWSRVDNAILINSWDSLLLPKSMQNEKCTKSSDADIRKAVELLHRLPGCEQCEESDVVNWFSIEDKYDIVRKTCDEEVLREFENSTLGPLNIGTFGDEAEPSHAKLSRKS